MTVSSSAAVSTTSATRTWAWPIDKTRYERRITLSEPEAETLRAPAGDVLARARGTDLDLNAAPGRPIGWLVRPLRDARAAVRWDHDAARGARYARDAAGLVLMRCGDLQRSFWGWSEQDWIDLIDPSGENFRRTWPGQIGPNARSYVLASAYLLTGFTAFDRVGRFQRPGLARRVFGRQPVDDAVRQVRKVLAGWGYSAREPHLTAMISQMFLLNGSPLLEDLTSDLLLRLRSDPAMGEYRGSTLYGVHRAVAALGHADPPPPLEYGPGLVAIEGTAPGWAEWVERWYATSALTPKVRASYRSVLSKAGRWRAAGHPGITGPGQWTRRRARPWSRRWTG